MTILNVEAPEYGICPHCKSYSNLELHQCPPTWVVRFEDYQEEDGECVFGDDAEDAALTYAMKTMEDWGEDETCVVAVREAGTRDDWQGFNIWYELEPEYHVEEVEA
jgi:hypothetical protein